MTVNLSEQLLPGTFEWALNYLIDRMDMSLFEKDYHNDETGATAYSPKALLKVIIYCYSMGIISSRRIEKTCKTNITVKALSGDNEPDHSLIADFISKNSEAVTDLFTQVLLQCSTLDLITGEMYSLDGCKLPSNASKEWSGTIEDLTEKKERLKKHIQRILERHKELDKDEEGKKIQEPFRKTMGDDRERRERSIERMEKKLKRLDDFLGTAKERIGTSGEEVQSNITDEESAKIKGLHGYIQGYNGISIADSGNQIIISAETTGSSESGIFIEMLEKLEKNMQKVTGEEKPLEKSIVTGDSGFFSEKNLQGAKEMGIQVLIPDPQFRQRDPDFEERKNEKEKKRYTIEDFTYDEENNNYKCPGGKILKHIKKMKLGNNWGEKYQAAWRDCGGCALKGKCIKSKKEGEEKKKRGYGRTIYIVERNYEENLSEQMREKIDNPAYRELYSRRQQIIEPTYSHITYSKGMNRFTLRGTKKVNIQWKLYCIVHNIWKCMGPLTERYGG